MFAADAYAYRALAQDLIDNKNRRQTEGRGAMKGKPVTKKQPVQVPVVRMPSFEKQVKAFIKAVTSSSGSINETGRELTKLKKD